MTIVYSGEGVKDTSGNLLVGVQNGAVSGAVVTGGRRNLIINGAMQVAQRGTSVTGITSSGYRTVDRWGVNLSSVDQYVCTVTQESDGASGFSNSLKIQTTTAETAFESGDSVDIEQRIEAQDLQHLKWGTSDAQSLTLSFWCKCNKTGTQSIHIRAHDASHGYSTGYTINAADTWEYKTVTISGNTTGSITNDNGIGIWIRWLLADGDTASTEDAWDTVNNGPYAVSGAMEWGTSTSDYFQITGVQLEVGSVATPFEHRSYGEELALCQRYYFRNINSEVTGGANCRHYLGYADTSTNAIFPIRYPVRMRAIPTLSYSGTWNCESSSSSNVTSISIGGATTYVGTVNTISGAMSTKGYAVGLRSNDTSAYIDFDAEL